MNNAKSYPPISIIFAIGAAIGIGIGLWIGWGLWPVEWQGGTLRDLDQAGKSEYIAAVADAFVIYDTPEAAAIARQRLAPLEGTLEAEFIESIRYFQGSAQTERVIRVSNIGRLASALGMVPPDLQNIADTTSTQANPAAVVDGESELEESNTTTTGAGTAQVEESTPAATTNISWFRWLLWLLAAILLLSGGIYLMGAAGILDAQELLSRFLDKNRRDSGIDEFETEDYEQASLESSPYRQGNRPVTFVSESEDLSFEQEEDDIDRFRYEPPAPSNSQEQEWQQPDWPPAYRDEMDHGEMDRGEMDHGEMDHGEMDRGGKQFDAAYQDNDIETVYETDVDNGYPTDNGFPGDKIAEGDWESAFEQEPEDDYDRFHSQDNEQNPAHFTIDAFQNRDAPDLTPSTTPEFNSDFEDNSTVQTINDLMATEHISPSSPLGSGRDERQEDNIHSGREEWQDEEFLEEEEIDDDDNSHLLHHRPERIDNQNAITSLPKEELERFETDHARHRTTPTPKTDGQVPPKNDAISSPQQKSRPTQGVPTSKRPRNQLIVQHTLTYQMGMAEYDESKPIVDPGSGKYIGEFGMGTSGKNGVVQPTSDYVAALEVWLFDKSDEKNLGNQTRILLSEYAVDHNLEQAFTKERTDNPRPFTPQPGVHFQLESQNLRLDCTIIDVKYLESGAGKGMFGSIRVDMSVHQKL